MVAAAVHLDEFFNYLRFQKSYSQHTVAAYSRDLNQYFSFQTSSFSEESVESTSSDFIRSWVVELVESGMKPASVNRKLSTLKSFFKFLRKTNVVKDNPASGIRNLKQPQRLPVYVRKSEADQMFDGLVQAQEESVLESAVMTVLYTTGIRRSELIDLKLKNVDLESATIKVFGKGKKERIVPLGVEAVGVLKKYLAERQSIESESDAFFVRPNGKQLYPKWVYNCVNKMLTIYSNSEKKSPHVLRHSFATHLLQNGAEIAAIKELLGHASLASTQIYAQSDIAHLKRVHKLHPKS
ncbi:MAG: tyrosine-type recombinase/integrase [Bacteroidia bacterium]|nr:tyrosine-type recombinase/integrase [Bacteroidia bacterium]